MIPYPSTVPRDTISPETLYCIHCREYILFFFFIARVEKGQLERWSACFLIRLTTKYTYLTFPPRHTLIQRCLVPAVPELFESSVNQVGSRLFPLFCVFGKKQRWKHVSTPSLPEHKYMFCLLQLFRAITIYYWEFFFT